MDNDLPQNDPAQLSREQARSGLLSAVARQAADGLTRATPPILLATLCAGALAPLAVAPPAQAALAWLNITAGVGTNILSQVISDAIHRLQRRKRAPEAEEIEQQLNEDIVQLLRQESARSKHLRKEIAALLRELDGVGIALEFAIDKGNRTLQKQLAEAFGSLGEQFEELGFLLTNLDNAAADIQRSLHLQEGERRHDREQMRRQSMQLTLLREEVAHLKVVRESTVGAPRWEHGSPYRGLWPFEADHEAIFYGREQTTARLVTKLAERLTGPSVLMVTGASGAGKSSLVRAGLLPALARGALPVSGSSQWPILLMTPTRKPLEELAAHLAALGDREPVSLLASLQENPEQAHLMVQNALIASRGSSDARLVLVVDQFEELFTVSASPQRDAFLTALVSATTVPVGPDGNPAALAVVVIRGDFVDRCADHVALADVLQDGQFMVGPMTKAELRRTVTGPAAAAGLALESGLADTILDDLGPQDRYGAGVLPLISQTLLVTWEHREGNLLTIRGYGRGGEIEHAIQVSADGVYEALLPVQQDIAQRMFRRMTVLSENGQYGRRRVARRELYTSEGRTADVDAVLNAFAAKRLVVVSETSVEIAHDYLLLAWPRLRDWLVDHQADHLLYRQFANDARDWQNHERDSSFLYRGKRLAAVQTGSWATATEGPIVLDDVERDFLATSVAASRRRDRQRVVITAILAALLVLTMGMGGLSEYHRRQSDNRQEVLLHQRDEALARAFAAQAEGERITAPDLAAKLSIAAWSIAHVEEAQQSLLNSLFRTEKVPLQIPIDVSGEGNGAIDGDISSSGRTFARYRGNEIEVWDVGTRSVKIRISARRPIGQVWLADDGKAVVAAYAIEGDQSTWDAEVFDTRTGTAKGGLLSGLASAAWYPLIVTGGGRYIAATALNGGEVVTRILAVTNMKQIGQLKGVWANFLAVAPDGRTAAVRKGVAGVTLRKIGKGSEKPIPLRNCSGGYTAGEGFFLDFSADGSRLALMPAASRGCLWDTRTQRVVGSLPHPRNASQCGVRFSVDGRTLATCDDSTLYIWNARDARLLVPYQLPVPPQAAVVSGSLVHWTSEDGRVASVNLGAYLPSFTVDGASTAALSADGSTLALISKNRLTVWDVPTERVRATKKLEAADEDSEQILALSQNGEVLAVAVNGRIWRIDLETGDETLREVDERVVEELSVSPDGKMLGAAVENLETAYNDFLVWIEDSTESHSFDGGGGEVLLPPGGSQILLNELTDDVSRLRLSDIARGTVASHDYSGSTILEKLDPGGTHFLTSDSDGIVDVTIWSTSRLDPVGPPIRTGTKILHSLSFSADGRLVITAGDVDDPLDRGSASIRIWDVGTRRMLGSPIRIPTSRVLDIAMSADHGRFVLVTEEGEVYKMDLRPEAIVRRLCSTLGAGLSEAEWSTYIGARVNYRPTCTP